MNVFREIRERHVLQAVGVYVGGCWVLIEILDRLVERYLLSPTLTDLFFWGLFSLLPAVILIAWSHGKPGKDKMTRSEIVGVPINLIATTGLLFTLFSGEHMGATANKVMVMNEDGQAVERYVPKAGFRHSLMVFFWDNQSGDDALDWLQYGVADMLTRDLSQNPYLAPHSAFTNYEWGFYSQLLRAGYNDALDVPLSLQREIAAEHNKQYFMNGSIDRTDDNYTLSASLFRPQGLTLVQQYTLSGPQIMALIDELSSAIKKTLEVPAGGGRLADDLPVVEQYTTSLSAMRQYIEARTQRLLNNDFEQALTALDSALQQDPSFALAGLVKMDFLLNQGRSEEAVEIARAIEPHEHKLTAGDRDILKANFYSFTGEPDKASIVLKMGAELNPNDAGAHWRLGDHYKWSGQLDLARLAYQQVLELDPEDARVLHELAFLYRAAGDMEQAIAYAQRYSQQQPDNMSAAISLGVLYQDSGERELARQEFERAVLLRPDTVSPLIRLAELAARSGNLPAAREYHEQATQVANNPQQHSLVLSSRTQLLAREGRLSDAIELLRERKSYEQQFNTPLDIMFEVDMQIISFYSMLGEYEQAAELLARAESQLQAPLDQFMQIGHAFVNITRGDLEAGEQAIQRAEVIIDQFGLDHVRFQMDYARGLMEEVRGNNQQSASYYQSAVDQIQNSIISADMTFMVSELYACVARMRILSGDLERAAVALEQGFRMDDARAELWTERARLQWQQGQHGLARASMNYALTIWDKGDRNYYAYVSALQLAEEIDVTPVRQLTSN